MAPTHNLSHHLPSALLRQRKAIDCSCVLFYRAPSTWYFFRPRLCIYSSLTLLQPWVFWLSKLKDLLTGYVSLNKRVLCIYTKLHSIFMPYCNALRLLLHQAIILISVILINQTLCIPVDVIVPTLSYDWFAVKRRILLKQTSLLKKQNTRLNREAIFWPITKECTTQKLGIQNYKEETPIKCNTMLRLQVRQHVGE